MARNQLLVCHYHAAYSHALCLVNYMEGRSLLSWPCLDQYTAGYKRAEGRDLRKNVQTFTFSMMREEHAQRGGFLHVSLHSRG